jgi:hypothetical protein
MTGNSEISPIQVERTTEDRPTGILAFFITLPGGHRRANFTKPRQVTFLGQVRFR